MTKQAFTVAQQFDDNFVSGLLCTAFEGGSNYWYSQLDYELAEGVSFEEFREGGSRQQKDNYWHWSQLIPLVEGCALTLIDRLDEETEEGKTYRITRDDLVKGLKIMAEKHPRHFADAVNENSDAITGDVFLQCVCFGDTVYG